MKVTETMTAEFTANCKANAKQLADLFKAYDLAKLGYEMQKEQVKECYTEALNVTPFYASEDYERAGVKAGDRITSAKHIHFLSDADFDRLLTLAAPILKREGITDAKGEYITNWLRIEGEAHRALINFILDAIVPEALRGQLEETRLNIVQAWKLFDIVRPIAQKTA